MRSADRIQAIKVWFEDGTWALVNDNHDGLSRRLTYSTEDDYLKWKLHGNVIHREDGPAVEGRGISDYYIHGVRMTENEHTDVILNIISKITELKNSGANGWQDIAGHKVHFRNGMIHCDDGPAIVCDDGSKAWFSNGLIHNFMKPAIKWGNGDYEFWYEGKRHRLCGPAVVYADECKDHLWYHYGALQNSDNQEHIKTVISKIYRCDPARVRIYSDHIQIEDELGVPHNEHGPAIEWIDGTREWRIHGELHCEDGPAYESPNGKIEYWENGLRHKKDGPAIIRPDGTQIWCQHGERHREDGPAVVFPSGRKAWYIHGRRLKKSEFKKWQKEHMTNQEDKLSQDELHKAVEEIMRKLDAYQTADGNGHTEREQLLEANDAAKVILEKRLQESGRITKYGVPPEVESIEEADVNEKADEVVEQANNDIGWGIPIASMFAAAVLGIGKSVKKKKKIKAKEEKAVQQSVSHVNLKR